MNNKYWTVSITLTVVGYFFAFKYDGTNIGDIGLCAGGIGGLLIAIGGVMDYLGLKFNFETIKRQPTMILFKVIGTVVFICFAIGFVCLLDYLYDLNKRTGSMIGGAIILIGVAAIWKPQKETKHDDNVKQANHKDKQIENEPKL